MSQKVNAVPDPAFSVPPLTTVAGTRVSRRRLRVPCNYPGTRYGHNGQSSLPSVVTFDIADNESFLDMDKSMIVMDFLPTIYHYAAVRSDVHPVSFDGSSQAILARVRIGNSQGLIIEELSAYGTWANIMENYSESENQAQHHLLDQSSAIQSFNDPQQNFGSSIETNALQDRKTKRLFLRFKHSSFLKSCRMIPLFLMRNGIRFEIEFEDVMKCFTRNLQPLWRGPCMANQTGLDLPNQLTPLQLAQSCDYWFQNNQSFPRGHYFIVKKSSHLAQALDLKNLILDNYNITQNADDGQPNSAVVSSRKWTGTFAIPLKFEYTDEFGTPKVLLQGIFELDPAIQYMTQSGGFSNIKGAQNDNSNLFILSETAVDGAMDFGIQRTEWDEYVYVFTFVPAYDGFAYPFANIAGETTAYLPYHKSMRVYYTDERVKVNKWGINGVVSNATNNTINATGDGPAAVVKTWNEESQHHNQPSYMSYTIAKGTWNYSTANIEMICDFVKPSSEVFLQFQQAFQSPSGIPYAYKRVLYHTRVLVNPDGLQQISLPVSVRSLRGIVCVLSDKLAWSKSADNSSKSFNSLSAFMKRGLIRAQLVIGGQNYPSYDLNMTENGVEQIPELECLFNVAGLGSFNPKFDRKELMSTRNYAIGLGYQSNGLAPFDGQWSAQPTNMAENGFINEYHDTSKFVLGISTMKKDGDFVTGVDTSQAGSVSLNLFFKKQKDVTNMYPGDMGGGRDVFVQIFSLADAVFTLQNDANLVRY
jgi:hypothetical protein